ncbi:histidine--tRNA ligase [Peribacillus frigoritolerans]|uniref:histidine--tRNA ligase n=1 Tax=Peribacillus frigoritolerans TaxID=450367 RepID=UPI00207A1E31|nr:histidine--tRNA ligase [Peribacillus frigoritolerans]MEE3953470.1 histidine--tRNA ligase [Peribacillus frigoritolerans]USK63439.1 histidine--tRNA ligase [Peribacillus frigoritolerans]
MKKMDYQNVKGTQDYLPQAEVVRSNIRRTLEDVFIQYGCKPLETPILNYTELLASKYGGGAEILEEMYTLTDRGERDLALRYDLTIPFAKVVAMNPTMRMPFKRYEIGKVFRDGPIKTGRFREFTQCDVDIVGVKSQIAEAELMIMALDSFRKLDLKVIIQYNNRKLLTGMLQVFETSDEKINKVVLILDKLEKVGIEAVSSELTEQGLPPSTVQLIKQFLTDKNNTSYSYFEAFSVQNEQVKQGLEELKELETYLKFLGVNNQCIFNPFLARGLEIYTGTIYEIFTSDKTIKSSIGSGGRYDNAIGGLIGTNENFSTVGISFGLDVIYTALNTSKEKILENPTVDFYVIPINTQKESFLVARYLRNKGYNVEFEMGNKKIGKALDKANKENFRNVIIIGEDEVKNNQFKIKDMFSGEERIESFVFNK